MTNTPPPSSSSGLLLGAAVLCCCSSSSVVGTFFSGFIPGTSPFITKKLKKLIQLIITDDAKPVDCENLHKYMIDVGRNPTMDSAIQSLSENEKIIGERVYMMGKMDVVSEQICDKSYMDSSIALFKNIQEARKGEDVTGFCSELSELNNENEDKRHPSYYWDESKKEFIKDREYFSNAFSGKSGPELHEPVIAKCKAVGINIR